MLPKMGVPSNPDLLYTPLAAQGPHSHILMTGGSDRGSYFIPQKIPTLEFVYPKKSLSVFASANFIIYLLES